MRWCPHRPLGKGRHEAQARAARGTDTALVGAVLPCLTLLMVASVARVVHVIAMARMVFTSGLGFGFKLHHGLVVRRRARPPRHRRHALDRKRQDEQPQQEGLEKWRHLQADYCSARPAVQCRYLVGSVSGLQADGDGAPSSSDSSARRRASEETLGFSRKTQRLPVRLQWFFTRQ